MNSKKEDKVIKPITENQYNAIRSSADFVVLTGSVGSGKEQSVNSKVLTINGWKRMGDIHIGDKLVAPLNDEESVVTNIYPQGKKPIYKLTTLDGRETLCGLEHLWMTKSNLDGEWKVITTREIIDAINKNIKIYIPLADKLKDKYCKRKNYNSDFIEVKSIEYVGEDECQCIMVSNKDHLYITDDYIVTHNTYTLYYAPINYLVNNPGEKIICFMRNVSDFWGAGKVSDTMKKIYPLVDRSTKRQPHDPIGEIIRNQVDMGVKFYNGSEVKFQQLDNESKIVIDKIAKGIQTKRLIFDECNKFEWNTITTFMARLRSDGNGSAQIWLAQNPERNCPLRELCGTGEHGGGWIADDGTPIKEMDGRVMYFFMHNGTIDETYFGRTKEEVYHKCKPIIDEMLEKDKDMCYEDFILSMVFYTFDMRDNKAMLEKNKRYRGFTANSATAQSSYANNWNYSLEDEKEGDEEDGLKSELKPEHIENMFRIPTNYIRTTEKITVDMAFTGSDNMVLMHWIGFHCDDIEFSEKNSFGEACNLIMDFIEKHNCDKSNLIVDVQGDAAIKDVFDLYRKSGYVGTDTPYGSYGYAFSGAVSATGKSKMLFERFKDEAAYLAVNMIKCGLITFDPKLKNKRYTHQKLKREGATTIFKQIVFESKAFIFDKTPTGRIRCNSKVNIHQSLKGFSTDLFDNIIMRCGTAYSICYEEIGKITGYNKPRFNASDMINYINVDKDYKEKNEENQKIMINSEKILNILSTI